MKSGTYSFVKLLSHQLTHLLCFCFYFMRFIDHSWFVILHRNIQHTKLLGGMCDTVKILSPNHHLFSPHTFDFIVNNSSLYHLKTLVKVIYPYHTFKVCFSRFPCISQWCFCCIHAIHHCMVWGTLLLVLFGYIYDPFTVT